MSDSKTINKRSLSQLVYDESGKWHPVSQCEATGAEFGTQLLSSDQKCVEYTWNAIDEAKKSYSAFGCGETVSPRDACGGDEVKLNTTFCKTDHWVPLIQRGGNCSFAYKVRFRYQFL